MPQRTSLYGIPIALSAFIILAVIWRRWDENEYTVRWDGWKEFLFAGDVQSIGLLRKYKVEYIYLSHSEMEIFKPNMAYLNLQFPIIYQNGDITIYKVSGETVVN